MLDCVIRGGTVVDGTGSAGRTADIGIQHGRIVEVGRIHAAAHREIDADGLTVTPGWLDVHTHYDGQATWDATLDPSFSSGVTTAIMGNCGVGFAPVKSDMHEKLVELMEGVEEIPGTALHAGLKWNWETFPEYLDVLESQPRTFDIGALIPHGPLRFWAMGDRVDSVKSATGTDLQTMVDQIHAGMQAGAFGLATSRTPVHRSLRGEMTPDFNVEAAELVALSKAVKAYDGYLQVVPEGIVGESPGALREEMDLVETLVGETGVNLHVLVLQTANDPEFLEQELKQIDRLNGPQRAIAQFGGRCTGAILSFLGSHPFANTPTFEAIAKTPQETWLEQLAKPDVRARILSEKNRPNTAGALFASAFDRIFDLGEEMDYEPGPERLLPAIAAREGRSVEEIAYDLLLRHSLPPRIYVAFNNYATGSLEPVRQALAMPGVVLGASDAGAHVTTVCDGSISTWMLTHWARDRKRGPLIPLEQIVHLMTQKSAHAIGLRDRGLLAPGMKADINIFDLDDLTLHPPQFHNDLPAGAMRIMQHVTGYHVTMVSGVVTRERDMATGELPGRLVRYRGT